MKACFMMQNQYSKIGHALAVHLHRHYGVDQFCAYIMSPGAKEFITTQRDIHYEPVLTDYEVHTAYSQENIDSAYLTAFEHTYGPPYLWQYLYNDRKLMMSIGPKEESTTVIDPLYSHNDLTLALQVRAKAIETFLKRAKPNFIVFFAIGTVAPMLLYHIAKKLGIQVFNIDFPRIGNRMCLSEDYNRLTGITWLAHNFQDQNEHSTPEHTEARALIKKFHQTGSLQLEYYETLFKNFIKKKSVLHSTNIVHSIKYLVTLTHNYLRNRNLFLYGFTDENPLRFLIHKYRQRYRAWRGLNDLFSPCIPGEEYVYYPLHFEPELATLLLSPFYFDQIQLIRYIARSVPLHYKIYIKEHPGMRDKRPRSFYKEILKLPNVKLINPSIGSFELIRSARLITTITGTVGWEACLLGKPVITFGEVFYNDLSFVKRVHDIETLPVVIRTQLEHFTFKPEELVDFVAAALHDSFPFDYSNLWFENDIKKLIAHPHIAAFCKCLMEKVCRI